MKDGVTTTTTTGFIPPGFTLPVTGQPVTQSRASVGGNGVAETFAQATRYGVEFYSSLWAIHALSDVAQVDTTRSSGGVDTLVASSVSTYSGWPSNAGEGVSTPATAAGFSLRSTNVTTFPFG